MWLTMYTFPHTGLLKGSVACRFRLDNCANCPHRFQAVQYLHSQNVIHRDIKSQNVFLTENGDVRLGDFGLCKHDKIRKETNRGGRLKRTLRKPFALYRRAATAMSTSSDSVQVGKSSSGSSWTVVVSPITVRYRLLYVARDAVFG